MRISEIISEAKSRPYDSLSDVEKHELLRFVHHWLTGSFMNKSDSPQVIEMWRKIASLFPPKLAKNELKMYRLVTLPIEYADKKTIRFRPAKTSISSWCSNIGGLDPVAGIASDFSDEHTTVRLAVAAMIPASSILATPKSIRTLYQTFAHDYLDRYPEQIIQSVTPDGRQLVSYAPHPDWPSKEQDGFTIDDVDYLLDVTSRRGGHMKQYECIVETPTIVDATVVRIYRIGANILRYGNDNPHQ